MPFLRQLALAAGVAALIAAGCGGGGRLSKADYEQKLRDAGNELDVAIPKVWNAKTPAALEDAASGVQDAFGAAADTLDVTPPPDVESANARVVSGFRRLAEAFGTVKAAAERDGVDAGKKKAQEIADGKTSRDTELAIKEISRRGYDASSLGG